MPIVRKVDPSVGSIWKPEGTDPRLLLAALSPEQRRGISVHPDGWLARVYSRGQTITRLFAPGRYGGHAAALQVAIAWRQATRRQFPLPERGQARPRLVRVDLPACNRIGYFVYQGRRKRRYFSDAAHGGQAEAQAAASAWLEGVRNQCSTEVADDGIVHRLPSL